MENMKRDLKIKTDKISKSFMPCDDWIKYSKQLKEYLHPPAPFKCTQPRVDRKN